MAVQSPRIRGLLDLWAAHRELSSLEWLEFQQTILRAGIWLACAVLAGLAGWVALNAAVIIAFRQDLLRAALTVTGVNLVLGLVAALKVRSLLKRPFFELTKREAARDVGTLLKVIT